MDGSREKDIIDIIIMQRNLFKLLIAAIWSTDVIVRYTRVVVYRFTGISENTAFILDGANSSEGFIPEGDEYDTYDFDEYYNRSGQELHTDRDLDLIDYISNNFALILSTGTHNLSKEYLLQILEVDRYMNPNPDIDADENGVIKLYKPRVRLSVVFQKVDAIYRSRKKYIDYHNIDSTRKFNALISDVTDESLVNIDDKIGIIVSKYKD